MASRWLQLRNNERADVFARPGGKVVSSFLKGQSVSQHSSEFDRLQVLFTRAMSAQMKMLIFMLRPGMAEASNLPADAVSSCQLLWLWSEDAREAQVKQEKPQEVWGGPYIPTSAPHFHLSIVVIKKLPPEEPGPDVASGPLLLALFQNSTKATTKWKRKERNPAISRAPV